MLASSLKLYREHFAAILGLVLTIALPCQLLLNWLAYHVFPRADVISNLEAALIIHCLFGIVLTGGILHALFVRQLERRAGYPECLSAAISNWLQLGWTNLLVVTLVTLGLTAFILPGLILLIRLCLANTVVMTEGLWGFAALRRSVELTADRSWTVIGLGLCIYLPLKICVSLAAQMLLTIPQLDRWEVASALGVGTELAGSLVTIALFCLYEQFVADESRAE